MKEKAELVGQFATIVRGKLLLTVEILDVKESYGRTRYLVSPVAGAGEEWVESLTLTSNPAGK